MKRLDLVRRLDQAWCVARYLPSESFSNFQICWESLRFVSPSSPPIPRMSTNAAS